MDELALLRKLVADEPVDAEIARADVWRRLSAGKTVQTGDRSRRRIVIVVVAAAVVVVAAASAYTAVSELLFDPSKPRQESRTVDGVEFTFTVPGGLNTPLGTFFDWENTPENFPGGNVYISKSLGSGQAAEAVIYWTAFPDGGEAAPCRNLLDQHVGGSTADLAAAMVKAPGITVVKRPTRLSVGGRPATHVVLTVRRHRGCNPGYFFTWRPRGPRGPWPPGSSVGNLCSGACWLGSGVGDTIRVWIVDVDGKRLVFAALTAPPQPEVPAQARDEWPKAEREMAGIIGSIRFG